MRNLQECKAEVFSRSEERIRKRKTIRRCVIAACLPVVLVIGAFSAMILPAMMPASSADSTAAENASVQNSKYAPMEYMEDTEAPEYSVEPYQTLTTQPPEDVSASGEETTVTVKIEGQEYTVTGSQADMLTELLNNLTYKKHCVCKCLPQLQVQTQCGKYGLHLHECYARCEKGQAKLTQEQIEAIREILDEAGAAQP